MRDFTSFFDKLMCSKGVLSEQHSSRAKDDGLKTSLGDFFDDGDDELL